MTNSVRGLSKCQFIVYNQFGTDPLIYQCLLNPSSYSFEVRPVYDGIGAAGLPGQQMQYVRNDSEEISFSIFLHIDTIEMIYRNKWVSAFQGITIANGVATQEPTVPVSNRNILPDIAFFRSLCYPDLKAWIGNENEPSIFIRSPIIDFVKGSEVYHGVITRMSIKDTMQNAFLEPVEATIDITMSLTSDSFDRIRSQFSRMRSDIGPLDRRF